MTEKTLKLKTINKEVLFEIANLVEKFITIDEDTDIATAKDLSKDQLKHILGILALNTPTASHFVAAVWPYKSKKRLVESIVQVLKIIKTFEKEGLEHLRHETIDSKTFYQELNFITTHHELEKYVDKRVVQQVMSALEKLNETREE